MVDDVDVDNGNSTISRSLSMECVSRSTASAEVTHPEQERQSDRVTVAFFLILCVVGVLF